MRVDPTRGEPGAMLGFPENGPYRVIPARMGGTARSAARDAYGRIELATHDRRLRGDVKPGNSGGPVVSRDGGVLATLFGQRQGSGDGFAVTNEEVEGALAAVGPPLETACVAR